VFLKLFCSMAPFSLSTHDCPPPSLIQQTQGSIFKQFFLKKSIHTMVPSSVWWMCLEWQPSQSLEILGDILVRYSRRSPRSWINKRFLCFENIKVITAEVNSVIVKWSWSQWSIGGSGWVFSLPSCCFPPYRLYFVRSLVRQNRPGGGDSAHFENHCSGR